MRDARFPLMFLHWVLQNHSTDLIAKMIYARWEANGHSPVDLLMGRIPRGEFPDHIAQLGDDPPWFTPAERLILLDSAR